ncbi:MAG: PLP-dependent aminotransferase family protein [Acidobacteria bacterium]|nr:PLP-dependent aminotransferase family protein [Acidobacteriota bacterium]
MLPAIQLNEQSDAPLYRQLYEQVRSAILSGALQTGERLPATRELAGLLGLNRTTVSAAYDLLVQDGLISGHVGRGSFVAYKSAPGRLNWRELLNPAPSGHGMAGDSDISFVASRPSELLFPLDAFRHSCAEVLGSPEVANILQLGAPAGYAPLRRYLLESARQEGVALATDDIVVTSGCQQALDLIRRALVNPGDAVAIEDPVYPGLKNAFAGGGARVIGVPVGRDGIDVEAAARVVKTERPRLLVVTSSFQNPTGTTLPAAARAALVRLAQEHRTILVENDIYGDLRYEGERIPTAKQLDETGDTILLRSFSKTAFPGLRVGWIVAPREVTRRIAEAKQWCDLHTDQLSQAVLLRFAESGRLAAHRAHMLEAGRKRLRAVLDACERHLAGIASHTRPMGGMSIWVTFDDAVDTADLLARAQREGVGYLPGRHFAVTKEHRSSARLSFAGLAPDRIEKGVGILGRIFAEETARTRSAVDAGMEPALV